MSEASGAFSSEEQQAGTSRVRRITLQQVQQSGNRFASPVARLGRLSVEAAKQHRLGVEADYFPKFSATFANLHYSKFQWPVGHAPSPVHGWSTDTGVSGAGLFSESNRRCADIYSTDHPSIRGQAGRTNSPRGRTHCNGKGWTSGF